MKSISKLHFHERVLITERYRRNYDAVLTNVVILYYLQDKVKEFL